MTPDPNIERLARQFHEAYERLAPSFGYETRRESAVPWDQVPEQNRALMMAVVGEVLAAVSADLEAARQQEAKTREVLRDAISQVIQMKRDLEAAKAALRQQDDVIQAMTFVLDDLLDRASDVNQPQRTHGNEPGPFALYAEQRLRELVGKVAALAAPDPEGGAG